MKIISFFENDINRNIETVIKADDQDHILDEVVEYVVTHEVAKKIRDFFEAYTDYRGANGVWISGFFGSGKSHLLKILSYVLENKEYDGYNLGELFAKKIEQDQMLQADVRKASLIPSESILFNIDQQAQITSKQDANAVLSVFYKVFYDHLGYYGFQPHVAEFEMWLDKKDQYHDFKAGFASEFGKPWEEARTDYFDPEVTLAIAKVLGDINKIDPEKYEEILDEIEDKQNFSIDDFCNKVHDYISTKPKGFRLNFFVDEVGQYISDNTKLMLNLQTIAESLATKTKGQAWILVTSQEDMEKVVGDMNKQQQNDFSRIQARFKLKIPLTSANVDEVIEKRLLKKNKDAASLLAGIYKKEKANLKTLISFSNVGNPIRSIWDEQSFIKKYPFIPYQFDLFQQCIKALSNHNAFQGKHASVGERSMLGVFQEVVKRIEQQEENTLVSFDLLFEGIRSTIRGEIQNSITLAERNLDDKFAIRTLKALFLVKYYSNFKTTYRDISVLMLDGINVDLKLHEKRVKEALNALEHQTYIQRNGELYEFLTDDEKDIEQEIKATDIDEQAVTQLLKEIIFDEIIRDNKIGFLDNKQTYDFTSKIDGVILGREKELTIEIITPNFQEYDYIDGFRARTMGDNTLIIMVLPPDERLLRDLKMYLRTSRYVKQSQSTSNKDSVKRILHEKGTQNVERKKTLVLLLNKLLGEADVYLHGSKKEMTASGEGKNRVVTAFQDLVKLAYPNLRMIGSTLVEENSIRNIIRSRQDDLFQNDDGTISEAENEVLNLINRRKKQSDRTSLSDLKEQFTRKPYGWYPNAIWKMAGKLYKRGKIEMRLDSNLLDDEGVLDALLNTRTHANTLLEAQIDIDPGLVRKLKEVYSEAFDSNISLMEAKDIALAFQEKLKDLRQDVRDLLSDKNHYPFLKELEPVLEFLDKLSRKEYTHYLTEVKSFEDPLLDYKEDLLDPIRKFWHGEQKKIYDSIRGFVSGNNSNMEFFEGEELNTLQAVYTHPKPYIGTLIRDAKQAMDQLTRRVLERIETEKASALQAVDGAIHRLKEHADFSMTSSTQQDQLLEPLEEELRKLQTQRFIANIRQAKERVQETLFPRQLNRLIELAYPVDLTSTVVNEPQAEYIRIKTVDFNYPKYELKTKEDVEDYVKKLKQALLEQIKDNKRITL